MKRIAALFNIPKTAVEIVMVLRRAKRPLLIKEIARYMGKSERTVRRYIKMLVDRGIVAKDVVVTKSKRLAYRYFLPAKEVFEMAMREEIENLVGRIYGAE